MKVTTGTLRATAVLSAVFTVFIVTGYAARTASAQVLYGSIVGTLTDETGAVVPKATVTVKNTATGLSRQATANDAGYYSFQNLPEGVYDLSVSAQPDSGPTRRRASTSRSIA